MRIMFNLAGGRVLRIEPWQFCEAAEDHQGVAVSYKDFEEWKQGSTAFITPIQRKVLVHHTLGEVMQKIRPHMAQVI